MDDRCSVAGCDKTRRQYRKMCGMHCARLHRYGRLGLIRRQNGSGNINADGYVDMCVNNRRVYEHVLVAERALGKPLPAGAVVHHADKNRANNAPSNLVVCPDETYHQLIHRRMAAMDACGNPNHRRCPLCGTWDDPSMLKRQNSHAECLREYARIRYQKNKALAMFESNQ